MEKEEQEQEQFEEFMLKLDAIVEWINNSRDHNQQFIKCCEEKITGLLEKFNYGKKELAQYGGVASISINALPTLKVLCKDFAPTFKFFLNNYKVEDCWELGNSMIQLGQVGSEENDQDLKFVIKFK